MRAGLTLPISSKTSLSTGGAASKEKCLKGEINEFSQGLNFNLKKFVFQLIKHLLKWRSTKIWWTVSLGKQFVQPEAIFKDSGVNHLWPKIFREHQNLWLKSRKRWIRNFFMSSSIIMEATTKKSSFSSNYGKKILPFIGHSCSTLNKKFFQSISVLKKL